MTIRRTALLIAAVAAAGTSFAAAPAAAECVDADLASACVVVDADEPCVGVDGHVDIFKIKVACSPR